MQTIQMTRRETRLYQSGDDMQASALMRDLRARAREAMAMGAVHVEIRTADGIVADAIDAEVSP